MEIAIFLVWFCLVWIIPLGFISTAYISYVNGRRLAWVVSTLVVGMLGFLLLSEMMIGPMFAGFFSGADPGPGGEGSNTFGRLTYLAMVLGYAAFGWLMCSVIYGRAVIPGRRTLRNASVDANA